MAEEDPISRAKTKILTENTAQAVWQRLRDLENSRPDHERRWVWELLQNAVDARGEHQDTVAVMISYDGQSLAFQHDGAPFNDEEVLHLIYYGTTKRPGTGKRGKFGTGFLTTHLLSRKVEVTGLLEDRPFSFLLSREGDSSDAILAEMKEAENRLRESLVRSAPPTYLSNGMTTSYRYLLNDAGRKIATIGFEDLLENISLLLAFVADLKGVTVTNQGASATWVRTTKTDANTPTVEIVEVSQMQVDATRSHRLLVAREEDITVAIPFEESVPAGLAIPAKAPRVFVDFPLFGTRALPIPAIINCPRLEPTENREGPPTKGDTPDVNSNKEIIERAFALLGKLAEHVAESDTGGKHHLAAVRPSPERNWLKQSWLDGLLAGYLESIQRLPLVEVTGAPPVVIAEGIVPVGPFAQKLRDVASKLRSYAKRLPRGDLVGPWVEILEGWASLGSKQPEELKQALTFDRVLQHIAAQGTVDKLQEDSMFASRDECLTWLKELLEVLAESTYPVMSSRHAFLPNQRGVFREPSDLKKDEGIHDLLKEIAELLGTNLRDELLSDVLAGSSALQAMNGIGVEDALGRLLGLARKHPESEEALKGNALLLNWLVENERWQDVDGFPVHTGDGWGSLSLSRRVLAPPEVWKKTPVDYGRLISPELVLGKHYGDHLNPEVWQTLFEKEFAWLDPLIKISVDVDDEKLFSFLAAGERVDTEKNHGLRIEDAIDLAFLELDKKGALPNVRDSTEKARVLLRMALTTLAKAEPTALEAMPRQCNECDQPHRAFSAAWLAALRRWGWIRIGQPRFKPTAESLFQLMSGDPELEPLLSDPVAIRVLANLGVGASDILKFRITDEKVRLDAESAAAILFQLAAVDPSVSRVLAGTLKDKELLEGVRKRYAEKERVQQNQKVGSLVENLLKETLEEAGIDLKRTGVGSDFETANDFIVDGQEQLLEVAGKHLIEVKATSTTAVKMTPKQVETAVGKQDFFWLCIVPYPSGVEVTGDLVRAGARFFRSPGRILGTADQRLKDFSSVRDSLQQPLPPDIEITGTESQPRVQLAEGAWRGAISFDDFTSNMKAAS